MWTRPSGWARRVSYQIGGNGGVHLRRRYGAVLFPGSEHAAAGGARRHRRSHRHRSGRVDGAAGRGRYCRRPARHDAGCTASTGCARCRFGSTPRIPRRSSSPAPGGFPTSHGPTDARVETWVESGTEVTPFYDPMLAKIIVRGEDRARRSAEMRAALGEACRIAGIETNLRLSAAGLRATLRSPPAASPPRSCAISSTAATPSTCSSRERRPRCRITRAALGYWHVGVPPSGPMDSLAFRLANRLVGNPRGRGGA